MKKLRHSSISDEEVLRLLKTDEFGPSTSATLRRLIAERDGARGVARLLAQHARDYSMHELTSYERAAVNTALAYPEDEP